MWSAIVGLIWYAAWTAGAGVAAHLVSTRGAGSFLELALPGGFLLILLYWQVVPLMMMASGAALDLRKLLGYPIPVRELFLTEVLLRATSALEMLLIVAGISIGIFLNPDLPWFAGLGAIPFTGFCLLVAVGARDLVLRVLSRRRLREIAFLLLITLAMLPRFLIQREAQEDGHVPAWLLTPNWGGWPWTATAHLLQGQHILSAFLWMSVWMLLAAGFGIWQFRRTLRFDADAAGASHQETGGRSGLILGLISWPSSLLKDPLGALVEKELRSMLRSPRFRMVFLMGFSFGILIWLPLISDEQPGGHSFLRDNFLTMVGVYALLLMSDVCFFNSFGFDRAAAQVYFLSPLKLSRVLVAKNLTATVFAVAEISAIAGVCGLLKMPFSLLTLSEAYSVAMVLTLYLTCAGNLLSVRNARGVNPDNAFRQGAARRTQVMLLLVYPLCAVPVVMAYLARYAFNAEMAFFGVLACFAGAGMVVYRIALESASVTADENREVLIARLSEGEGPISI